MELKLWLRSSKAWKRTTNTQTSDEADSIFRYKVQNGKWSYLFKRVRPFDTKLIRLNGNKQLKVNNDFDLSSAFDFWAVYFNVSEYRERNFLYLSEFPIYQIRIQYTIYTLFPWIQMDKQLKTQLFNRKKSHSCFLFCNFSKHSIVVHMVFFFCLSVSNELSICASKNIQKSSNVNRCLPLV